MAVLDPIRINLPRPESATAGVYAVRALRTARDGVGTIRTSQISLPRGDKLIDS